MWVFLALAALMLLLVGGIIALVLMWLTGKGRPERSGWQPGAAGGRGVWNAQLMGGGLIGALGGTANARFGLFVLEAGSLSFIPEGTDQPTWTVLCRDLFFTFNGAFSSSALELRGPMGSVRCDVSVEHINRWTRNPAKSLREGQHAQGFVAALVAHGARGA